MEVVEIITLNMVDNGIPVAHLVIFGIDFTNVCQTLNPHDNIPLIHNPVICNQ